MKSYLLLALPFAAAASLGACGGNVTPSGGATGQSVSESILSRPVFACGAGLAHPNVCCSATPGEASACLAYPDAPFQPCNDGQQTFPDPRSCCPLDGTGACSPPAADAGPGSGGGGSGGGYACTYPCPPNFAPSGGACCPVATQGATSNGACIAYAVAPACPPTPACDCPAESADGGVATCECDIAAPCTTPPAPQCEPCPDGWQVPEGEPGLCCQENASGIIACFSQAIPPLPPGEIDAGPIDPGPPDTGVGCACAEPACAPGETCPLPVCDCDAGGPLPTVDAAPVVMDARPGCLSASDCTGALPALAEQCSDGGYAAAHWECVNGGCETAFCQ
jgi:hypothetical protein